MSGVQRQAAVVFEHDFLGQGQAHAGLVGPAGKKGIENVGRVGRTHAWAIVGYGQLQAFARGGGRQADGHGTGGGALQAVAKQFRQSAGDLVPVDHELDFRQIEAPDGSGRLAGNQGLGQFHGLVRHLGQPDRLGPGRPQGGKTAHGANQGLQAFGLVENDARIGRVEAQAFELAGQARGETAYGEGRVADLVGHRGGQLVESPDFFLLDPVDLLEHVGLAALHSGEFRDVVQNDHHAGGVAVRGQIGTGDGEFEQSAVRGGVRHDPAQAHQLVLNDVHDDLIEPGVCLVFKKQIAPAASEQLLP